MTTTSQFKKQWYFSYDPLDRSYDSFRLLTIQPGKYSAPLQCTLSHERISSVQDGYSALSYTWGTRATERWIRLNGIPFMVQPSLFEALKGIRKEDEQIQIWADGICINQSDTKERNHQVGLMGKIYSGAKNVRVWLGPAADDSDFVLEYVERAEAQFQKEKAGEKLDDDPKPGEEEEKAFLEAFRALHRRPYWGRAWIKQEVILAKELIIHCGTKSANGLRLLVLAHWHCFWPFDNGGCGALTDEIANLSIHRLNRLDGKREPLEVLLKRYGCTGCTDVRDRVFSLLSIAADCEGNEEKMVDYSISLPALFFSILGYIQPQDIISLATTLHEILGVPRAAILDYWDKVEVSVELGQDVQHPPKVDSELENVAISTVWCIKATKRLIEMTEEVWPKYADALKESASNEGNLAEVCEILRLEPFNVRCSLLLETEPRFLKGVYPTEADETEKVMDKDDGRGEENKDSQPPLQASNTGDRPGGVESEDGQEGEAKEGDRSHQGKAGQNNRCEGTVNQKNEDDAEGTDDDHALVPILSTEDPLEKAKTGQEDGDKEMDKEDNGQKPARKLDYTHFQISDTDYFILARKTIFGLRFLFIFHQEKDASAETGSRLKPTIPNLSPEDLKPFMIYPRIALRQSSESLLGRAPSPLSVASVKLTLEKTYGTIVLSPPIEVMCCVLYELERLSADRGICTNECRYVLEACGYELRQLGRTLAQFRIQEEHERRQYSKIIKRLRAKVE